jgi:signal peptidase I
VEVEETASRSAGTELEEELGSGVGSGEPGISTVLDEGMTSPKHAKRSRWRRLGVEALIVVVAALGLSLLLRTYVVQSFYIPSGSMEPTLMPGDRILVDKLSYDLHKVHTGDIIVFHRPPDDPSPPSVKYLVKRVIGLPGQEIASKDGQVLINGHVLKEPWLPKGVITTGIRPQRIPPDHYFVMGDNRGDSLDSRYFGPISGKLIVGRVFMRFWPLNSIRFFGWP